MKRLWLLEVRYPDEEDWHAGGYRGAVYCRDAVDAVYATRAAAERELREVLREEPEAKVRIVAFKRVNA